MCTVFKHSEYINASDVCCRRCGARVNQKNARGDSAYDLAVKNGRDSIVKKFASHVGLSSLDKLAKPRPARNSNEV